jgi:hypothetical protein
MRSAIFGFAISLALTFTGHAYAQEPVHPPAARTGPADSTGTVVAPSPNTTGNDRNVTIAPGATGASTVQTDSAAGGNAGQPERAVPQGGASGSGSR